MTETFAVGQYVEMTTTIPSDRGSIVCGTRGIVRAIDEGRDGEPRYLVAFLASERVTGETAWVEPDWIFEA